MKITISKDELSQALNIALKGMASHSTLPILSGILIDANAEGLVIQSTDLEISIRCTAQADIAEPGRAVVPGKLFADIVKNLPDAAVTVACNQETTTVTCGQTHFTLSSINPADFPFFPDVEAATTVVVKSDAFADVIKRVSRAVSRDEARPILTGIEFTLEGSQARFISTDSYRLTMATLDLGEEYNFDHFSAVVPGKTLNDVSRLAQSYETLRIGFSETQVIFEFGNTVYVSRCIEGNYPNCMQIIPKSYNYLVELDTGAFTTAVKRVSLLAQAHTSVRLQFSELEQTCTVSAYTQDVGDASETVPAQVEGGDIEIAFNHQYLLDGLACVKGDTRIELNEPLKPGVIKGTEDLHFLYLAMPIRL